MKAPSEALPAIACVAAVVTDFSPLRVPRAWATQVAAAVDGKFPVYQVSASFTLIFSFEC